MYSNKELEKESIVKVFRSRGHNNVQSVSKENATLIYSNKTLVDNKNFLNSEELGGGSSDFALGIGTYFYKGSYGPEALRKIYEDLETVLANNPVYGHWAFCIRKN